MEKYIIETIAENLEGEISALAEDLQYYSTDGSVFEIPPSLITFPKDSRDVQALVRTANQLRREGKNISLTARGNGTDQGGGPINDSIIVDFMRHMDQILEIGNGYVVVQPGCIYERLQDELKQTNQYLPPYPASVGICTIGGAVANNSAGEKSVKYGSTRNYVEALQIVLADGTATWIYDIDEFQLNQKKALDSFEGAIYKEIDQLIQDHSDAIYHEHPNVTKESSGYALWKVKDGDKYRLPQLIVGSQGTLGLITAIRLRTMKLPDPLKVTLLVSFYDDIISVSEAAKNIKPLNPSALEIVDKNLLLLVSEQDPILLDGLLPEGEPPAFVLLTEFDDQDDSVRKSKEIETEQIIHPYAVSSLVKYLPEERASYWKLRRSAAAVMWTIPGTRKALPIIEDGTVPPDRLSEFLTESYKIFEKYDLKIAVWGHAGDGNLHMQPFIDLSNESERDKIFTITTEYYSMIQRLGGTAAGEHNDSLMRAPYRHLMFGQELEELFIATKQIFDPTNIFNPNKKNNVSLDYIKKYLRHEYSIKGIDRLSHTIARDKIDN